MRVLSCMILLALLGTAFAGCSSLKKNSNNTQTPAGGGAAPAKFPNSDPLLPTPPAPSFPAGSGAVPKSPTTILAGSVTDAYHNPVPGAYVRWVRVGAEDKDAAPIDVTADVNGYFIIQGVQQGATYKLIARSKQGEKLAAGELFTEAPNVHAVIAVRPEFVNSSTPPIPNGPAYQAGPTASPTKNIVPKEVPNLPMTIRVPAPSQDTPVANPPAAPAPEAKTGWVPGVAETPKDDRLPMLTIPIKPITITPSDPPRPPLPTPAPPSLPPLTPPPGDAKLDTGPTQVPSCVLVGSRLVNLALKDSKGQTWEYKKQGAGKVVLLDFWGTYCLPCRETMPILNRLQAQYGSRGLVVVGISLEKGQNERQEADAVNKLASAMQLNYRQLMGRTAKLDVGKQFNIDRLPTLMLLNEQGDVIYHHLGMLDAAQLAHLERIIQDRLNNRQY